jgi:lipopolysaccharide export system protein LptA
MRGLLRWLILVAIAALAGLVGYTYQTRTGDQTQSAPKPATSLPDGVNIQSEEWTFTQSEKGREKARMRAKNFRQMKESSKIELEGVTLEIPHKDGKQYDRIKTAKAEFDQKAETLYADGDVEIFMDVPEGAEPTGRLIKIVTSGVWFERSGKAHTQRDVSFEFERGSGKSTGALYDTSLRELHLNKNVELIWKGAAKDTIPMEIQSDNAVYREMESTVYLLPWSKLRRGGLNMEAGATVVKLKEGRIDIVETQKAKGVQEEPGKRKLEFAADFLVMMLTPEGQVTKITGDTKARLDSLTKTSRTAVTCDKVLLDFEAGKKESALTKAFAGGKAVLVSTPLVNAGETRVIQSEAVELFMRPGGEEIDRAETASPSTLELIPNRASQPHRWLNGERFLVRYGKENQIDHFETTAATTRTKPVPKPGAKKPEPMILTSSKKLDADFDPKTGQLAKLHQTDDFQYEAGDRKARSLKAEMDQATEIIYLTGAARVWDPTGSTTGDTVQLNQKTGEFVAEGNVTSTRLPDKKPGKTTTAMMSHEDPTQATARKMTSRNNNRLVLYEGNAVTWQGSNRVTADRIEIDRENEVLRANGNVVSQFADRAEDGKKKSKQTAGAGKAAAASPVKAPAVQTAPVFTIVKAPELIYTEADKMAHYREGAVLTRPGLTVKGEQIRAYLNDSSEESSLSRAVTDGKVAIVQTVTTPQKRTRTGTSEHADYYPDEEKIVLLGGTPLLIDSIKGRTTGRELIYFSANEKLIVDGVEQKPTESVIKRKAAAK